MTPDPSQDAAMPGASRPSASFVSTSSETTLSEALVILRKRRWVVIPVVFLAVLIGLYRALTQPKLYVASGRIEVRANTGSEFRLSASPLSNEDPNTKMQTEVTILQSDTLLLSVARELNLVNNPDFLGVKGPVRNGNLDDPTTRQGVLFTLHGNLKVNLVQKTDIIEISYSSLNGKLSADIVNKLIADYMERSYETRFASTQRVSQWLSGQLDDLKQKVETSQERMMDLQRKLGVLGVDQSHNEIASSIDDLQKAAGQAELARILAEERYRMLSSTDPNAIEGPAATTSPGTTSTQGAGAQGSANPPATLAPGLAALRSQLATLRADYAQMESTLGPNHPKAKAARAQITSLQAELTTEQNRLLLQAKQDFQLAKANEDQTQAALEQQKSDAYKLRDDMVEYTLRQRDFDSERTLYDSLLQRLQSAGVEAGLGTMEIDIVDQAVPPAFATLQPKTTAVLTAGVIGVIVGILLAFLLESLDTGLRSIAEIENVTGLPSLAIIPRSRRSTAEQMAGMSTVERNINVLTQPKSQFTESFRSLRTALLLSGINGREPRRLLFTSATPSEGKTTAATNLATILAQSGTRVLLIDADLRRPNLHVLFNSTVEGGLSTILGGKLPVAALSELTLRVDEVPGLDILLAGPIPAFSAELLGSSKMKQALDSWRSQYDFVILDGAPVLPVTDSVVLSSQADATFVVARYEVTQQQWLDRSLRTLRAHLGSHRHIGVVLNGVERTTDAYYKYYGYTNNSDYGKRLGGGSEIS